MPFDSFGPSASDQLRPVEAAVTQGVRYLLKTVRKQYGELWCLGSIAGPEHSVTFPSALEQQLGSNLDTVLVVSATHPGEASHERLTADDDANGAGSLLSCTTSAGTQRYRLPFLGG